MCKPNTTHNTTNTTFFFRAPFILSALEVAVCLLPKKNTLRMANEELEMKRPAARRRAERAMTLLRRGGGEGGSQSQSMQTKRRHNHPRHTTHTYLTCAVLMSVFLVDFSSCCTYCRSSVISTITSKMGSNTQLRIAGSSIKSTAMMMVDGGSV